MPEILLLPGVADAPPVDRETFDVVVAGSGAAGLSAAVTAAHAGAGVVVVEKGKRPGGTTRRSGGQYWIPGNSRQREAGIADDADAAVAYMARLTHPNRFDAGHETLGITEDELAMLRTYVRRAHEAVDALESMGALTSMMSDLSLEYPFWGEPHQQDYHADLQDKPVLGRHMNAASGESGESLVAELTAGAKALGVPIRCLERVVGLLTHDGRVVGVATDSAAGRRHLLARRGVVFGSGGFAHNRELARRHLRGNLVGTAAFPANTGDFQQLAGRLGVPLGNMTNAWWNQVAVEESVPQPKSPAAVWLPFGDATILVNKYGERVVNEKAIYNERAQAHFAWDAARREYPNHLLFMLFDHQVVKSEGTGFRWPVPQAGEKSPLVVRADSWDEMAEKIAARLARLRPDVGPVELAPDFVPALKRTIARFNAFADAGVDADFRRHATPRLAWHTPMASREEEAPLMRSFPLDGPFYCVIVGLGALDTKGGPLTDTAGRVLDAASVPVPGLYAAGNAVASVAGQAYWSAGTTIGLALTFGHLAGLDAAEQPPFPVDGLELENSR